MKISITRHPDGTIVLDLTAETSEDFEANKLLLRYDTVPVIDGETILGSWDSRGSFLQVLVHPYTEEEIRDRAMADAMIGSLSDYHPKPTHLLQTSNDILLLPETARSNACV